MVSDFSLAVDTISTTVSGDEHARWSVSTWYFAWRLIKLSFLVSSL